MNNLPTTRRKLPQRRDSGSRGGSRIAGGGFTLLEVIMGVALISLLFGGVYGIANASVDLGRSVSESRLKEMRISGLVNLLRKGFESLPPGSRLELPDPSDPQRTGTVRVVDAPGLWAWSEATAGSDAVALFAESDSKGTKLILAHLRLAGGRRIDSVDAEFETYSRTSLVALDTFRWEFFDAKVGEWVREWSNESDRPGLISVSFALPGDPEERRHVFSVAPAIDPDGVASDGKGAPTSPNGNTIPNRERGAGS